MKKKQKQKTYSQRQYDTYGKINWNQGYIAGMNAGKREVQDKVREALGLAKKEHNHPDEREDSYW